MKPVNVNKGKLLNISKLIILPGTIGFIIYKLLVAYNLDEILNGFSFEWDRHHFLLLGFTLLLMIANWLFETAKWRIIMGKHEQVTFIQSCQAVLSGIALSIVTPNQMGDIVGKAVFLQSYDKIKGAIVSLLGGVAQTVATIIFGSFGIWGLLFELHKIGSFLFIAGLVVITILVTGIYYTYLHIKWLGRLGRWEKIKQYVEAFTLYSKKELIDILLFSIARFCIFSFQYFLLLRFFNIDIPFYQASLCICSIFFIQGFVPSFILIEVGVRGATALFFFGMFTTASAGILLSAYTLWIINLMIPAIAGMYYLLNLKWSNPS